MKSKVPVESNGLRTYLTHSTFDPATLHGTDWPHDPAGLHAMFVDSALPFYAYSGDRVILERVREMLDYQLAHGTTPSNWNGQAFPTPVPILTRWNISELMTPIFARRKTKSASPAGVAMATT